MIKSLTARCHCGALSIIVPEPPREITRCNCSLCTATGFLGCYYDPATVAINGIEACSAYIQGDRMIATWHCCTCGVTTHWTPIPPTPPNRMGINVRLFAPEIWEELPVRKVDGRAF